jgi:acyl carrier protein
MTRSKNVTSTDIKRKLGVFIRNKFLSGNKDIVLDAHDSFLEKGLIDSTGVLELVGFIEETYGIIVEDEELIPDNLDSLDKLENFIARKLRHVGR